MNYAWFGWLLGLLFTAQVAGAQNFRGDGALNTNAANAGAGRQRIEAAKIGLITNRLNLSTDQAPQFWAIYNEYNAKKQELNRRVRQLNNTSLRNNSDEQVVNGLREVNATKQKLADLDEEYMSRFLKVISPVQLAELYKTEQMFNKMLLNKLNQGNQ